MMENVVGHIEPLPTVWTENRPQSGDKKGVSLMKIKLLIKKILKTFHYHNRKLKDIYIFTLPRSGSTWLMEIIGSQPKIKIVQEPLSLEQTNKEFLIKYFDRKFLQERYIDLNVSDKRKMRKYFDDLSEGKLLNSFYFGDLLSGNHSFISNRSLFKTHKITGIIDFFDKNFNIDIVYLVRHPISNSLSRIRNGWKHYIDFYMASDYFRKLIGKNLTEFVEKNITKCSILEKFVISWCFENFVLLKKLNSKNNFNNNFILLTYEQMVVEPDKVIRILSSKLELYNLKDMYKKIFIPSRGIRYSTKEIKKKF